MKIQDIRAIAKKMGIKVEKLGKTELIRSIQKAEGNLTCYATSGHECDQINCIWREDCIKEMGITSRP